MLVDLKTPPYHYYCIPESGGSPVVEPGRRCGGSYSSQRGGYPRHRASTEPAGGGRTFENRASRWDYLDLCECVCERERERVREGERERVYTHGDVYASVYRNVCVWCG